jgi:hypothetical protein
VPQVFDLWQDPQERYDIFMNNYTERTWTMVTISDAIKKLMETYVKYPPRKLQSASYSGPLTITVHAPRSAMPQPNFVPVMPSTSRKTQRSGVSPSTSTLCTLPLTLMAKTKIHLFCQ